MSDLRVLTVKISEVLPHPNADRLEVVKMDGMDWQCVTGKGLYHPGDKAFYFPIDSILPIEIETKIFGIDSKIKLHNSRVKTIKLRGAISQGLVVKPELLIDKMKVHLLRFGQDFTKEFGVTKYEPPVKLASQGSAPKSTLRQSNPSFRKYTSIENAKNYNAIFKEGEDVSITEKIHGTNFRAGYVPFYADTFWKKVKKFLGLAPEYEFVYGSHNVQLQSKLLYKGYYDKNVYSEAVVKYNLKDVLAPGQVVYGEIYGDGIQKGYLYGCKPGERKLVLFDALIDGVYLNTVEFRKWAYERDLPIIPELYRGPFNKEKVLELRDGDSVLATSQKVREGVVVKPIVEEHTYIGRKMLKYISDFYLLRNQDDETEAH